MRSIGTREIREIREERTIEQYKALVFTSGGVEVHSNHYLYYSESY